jgi:hypothetical protein
VVVNSASQTPAPDSTSTLAGASRLKGFGDLQPSYSSMAASPSAQTGQAPAAPKSGGQGGSMWGGILSGLLGNAMKNQQSSAPQSSGVVVRGAQDSPLSSYMGGGFTRQNGYRRTM